MQAEFKFTIDNNFEYHYCANEDNYLQVFPVLWIINKKCYKSSQKNRHLHTLADRYHIKENLCTIHSLIYLVSKL